MLSLNLCRSWYISYYSLFLKNLECLIGLLSLGSTSSLCFCLSNTMRLPNKAAFLASTFYLDSSLLVCTLRNQQDLRKKNNRECQYYFYVVPFTQYSWFLPPWLLQYSWISIFFVFPTLYAWQKIYDFTSHFI